MGKNSKGSKPTQASTKRFRKPRRSGHSGKCGKITLPDPDLQQRANKCAQILYSMGYSKLATRVRQCVWRRGYRHIHRCQKRFLCRLCARRFTKNVGREVESVIRLIASASEDTRFFAVTLTVPDGGSAEETCQRLRRLLRRVHQRRSSGWRVVDGTLWFIEIHKGKDHKPRPHIHAIVAITRSRVQAYNRAASTRLRVVREKNRRRAQKGRPPLKKSACPLFAPPRLLFSWAREVVVEEGLDPASEEGRARRDVLLRHQCIFPLGSQSSEWVDAESVEPEPWPALTPGPDEVSSSGNWWTLYACKSPNETADISFTPKELVQLQVSQLGPLRGARGCIREIRTALRQAKLQGNPTLDTAQVLELLGGPPIATPHPTPTSEVGEQS